MNLISNSALLITFSIFVGIVINLFRWTKRNSDARMMTIIMSSVIGLVLFLFMCVIFAHKEKLTEIPNPQFITYSSIGEGNNISNYLTYQLKDEKTGKVIAYHSWIDDIETESKKKFYSVEYYSVLGFQVGETRVERR